MALPVKRRDKVLDVPLETERFVLQPLGPMASFRLTDRWRNDPELLSGLFQDSRPKGRLAWLLSGAIPIDAGRHAWSITPRGAAAPIGGHIIKTLGYRSAICTVALHDRDWWGKGVVVEVRARLMNHFFAHSDTERFYGIVSARNASSVFNYRRLGFDHTGTWHRALQDRATGEIIDLLHFEMFRARWQAGRFSTLPLEARPQ